MKAIDISLLKSSLAFYRRHFALLSGVLTVCSLATALINLVHNLAISCLLGILIYPFVWNITNYTLQTAYNNETFSLSAAFKLALKRFLPQLGILLMLILAGCIAGVVSAVGAVFFSAMFKEHQKAISLILLCIALVCFSISLMRFTFAGYLVSLNGMRTVDALKESMRLTKGRCLSLIMNPLILLLPAVTVVAVIIVMFLRYKNSVGFELLTPVLMSLLTAPVVVSFFLQYNAALHEDAPGFEATG